ncbi:stalk domain-containing protein [Brevibacillus sp. H7]|uniref:stalk domain-containing protein n=1 Tax=Brevibacillus sp. H7 TaxID=3349138 RepID=UPI00382BCA0F
MNVAQKTSILICLTIFVVFASVGVVVKWPVLEAWLNTRKPQSATPSGADPFAYDPPIPSLVQDLRPKYTIRAELNPTEAKISGSMAVEFDNPKTTELRFYLYDYPWSPMTVKSIRQGKKPLAFDRRQSVVRLKNTFANQSRIALTVEFESAVPRRGTRFGVKDDIWTLTTWYPMLGSLNRQGLWYEPPQRVDFGDPFVYHYADYDVSFVSPRGYQWVSSWGRGEAKDMDNGRKEVRYQAKQILNFALVGSPLYHVETIQFDPNLTVDIASVDKANIQRIKAIAEKVFPAYLQLYGPLPYPRVAIAETGTGTTYAMEYANMAMFKRDLQGTTLVDHWLPHEVAHMWWYNSVATLESTCGWIDEGLVEMSVVHYKQKRYGDAAANSVLQEFGYDMERLKKRYPYGKLGKSLHQFTTYDEFKWTWYSKGALLYNHLRKQIGDEAYSRFLKRVQLSYHGSVIGPEHLDQALGQALHGEARYFLPNALNINDSGFVPLYWEPYVTTVINGISYYPDVPARLRKGTVYIPLRSLMERLGYRVSWSKEKQAIHITGSGKEIFLRENDRYVTVNRQRYELDQPLVEVGERTMVPLGFFQQVLGYDVSFEPATKTVKMFVPQTGQG